MLKKLWNGLIFGLGYMLSPLSWWNDLFFNLPIAYGFGYAIGWLVPGWFIPATIAGYWLSNVLGIVLMQVGALDMLYDQREKNLKRELLIGFGTSTLYTVAIVALVYFHILEIPDSVLAALNLESNT
jgi:hypothetical protein